MTGESCTGESCFKNPGLHTALKSPVNEHNFFVGRPGSGGGGSECELLCFFFTVVRV